MRSILALLFLLASALSAAEPSWKYLPTNTHDVDLDIHTDGLIFFFEGGPLDSRVEVTIEAIQNGKPVTVTQNIDTNRERGELLVFRAMIDEPHRHELIRVQIRTGGRTYTWQHPRSGEKYVFVQPRVPHSLL